ncbi:hypothetical protein TC41_2406 [Alicyclobacillus acidocaldarius subsp. acidocaldarius Tc-4-1]|uniref:Uncharacterized protein n=1 Tax=Alicyclobacillus acidocaldarius (strain Tc-4-1) TaxID=1048834 RepID=F8IGM6_ALIAT|nr:hypothetical protein TC41_2406 [Alicyclobacillus acidocaldarius subsp. acidocaldarius Tc-4-1]
MSIFWMIAGVGMATGTALLLSNTLQHGVVPAALKAFMAMFGS